MAEPIRILLVAGTASAESTHAALLRTAQAMTPEGVATLLYAGLGELPPREAGPGGDGELPAGPAELHALLTQSDAIVFCTPQSGGGLPGELARFLDWSAGGALRATPVAWIDACAPPDRADAAHAALRAALIDAEAALVDGACARIPVTPASVGADGLVTDARVRSSAAWVLSSIADYIRAQRRAAAERERYG